MSARDLLRRLDSLQQRHRVLAVAVALQRKLGDDNAGSLVAQLTYAGFVTVFPLLLLLVTVVGLVFSSDPSVRHSILHSTLSNFPLVGSELGHNVHALKKSSVVGLVVSLVVLAYGCFGLAGAGMFVVNEAWDVPLVDRPNFLPSLLRSALFLLVLGIGVVVSTFLSGVGTFGSRQPVGIEIGAVVVSLLLNCLQYLLGLRVLTAQTVPTRDLLAGAVVAGVGWTVLQAVGTYLVGHTLKGDSSTYGTFAVILGLLAWIYMAARLTVYAVELNVVLARRLWPRSLAPPPLTAADRKSLAARIEKNKSRPEEHVAVTFEDRGET